MKFNVSKLFSAVASVAILTASFTFAQEVPSRPTASVTPIVNNAPKAELKASGKPVTIRVGLNKSVPVFIPGNNKLHHFVNPGIAKLVKPPRKNKANGSNAYFTGTSLGSTFFFATDDRGNVSYEANIEVGVDADSIKSALAEMLPDETIEVSAHLNKVYLKGYVRSAVASARAVEITNGYVADPADVTNSIEILGSQQVVMQVRIAEIKRTALKQLGVNLGINGLGAPGSRGISFSTTSAAIPNAFLNNGLINTGLGGFGPITFEALETQGLAKTLAEPTLTAQSGQSASFLAGGSIPVPELANGIAAVRMVPYGIGLDFTPTVLDKGRINLVVRTTVSEIDDAVTVQGVPGLKEKTTSTTIDLPSGGTLFIAGLIQNDVSNNINGVPGLKDLPILGALFRSDTFKSNETELVITMTAYLAKPVSNATRLALPTDGFAPASDIDFFLLGRLHKTYTNKELPPYATPLAGPYGYIME